MKTTTEEDRHAIRVTLQVARVLAETIRESPDGIPAGVLYALVADRMSLATFEQLLSVLELTQLVKRENHLLTWIGPVTC